MVTTKQYKASKSLTKGKNVHLWCGTQMVQFHGTSRKEFNGQFLHVSWSLATSNIHS